jgi:hypothetical protein
VRKLIATRKATAGRRGTKAQPAKCRRASG